MTVINLTPLNTRFINIFISPCNLETMDTQATNNNKIKIGNVSSLHCYPIKSCGALTSSDAECTQFGLEINGTKDRYFMVIRENGDFVTQRQIPKMASIKLLIKGEDMILHSEFMNTECTVPLNPKPNDEQIKNCRVWKDHIDGQDCGDAAGAWLSECVDVQGLRLVVSLLCMKRRPVDEPQAPPGTHVAYPDNSPMLVVNTASLDNLKAKIPNSERINSLNFRPNLVIESEVPWDEDKWSSLHIGDVHLNVLQPCGRCVLTTVDYEICERRPDGEPLKTLKTFRVFPDINKTAPMFGVYTCVVGPGQIKVGDPVYATYKS